MQGKRLIRIRVSLKGRPIKSYTFDKECISVGRNPEADVFLDNPGVSRDHLKLVAMPGEYYRVQDLDSANGTFLNDEQVTQKNLINEDVIRVGKFSLWIQYDRDRRDTNGRPDPVTADMSEGTTVLSTRELDEMMTSLREAEGTAAEDNKEKSEAPASPPRVEVKVDREAVLKAVIAGFVLGAGMGMAAAMSLTWSSFR